MPTEETGYAHIEIKDGKPYLAGTGMKLVMLVVNHLSHGWDGKELHEQFPHLTLGQIYGALSYYYDHKAAIDQELEVRRRLAADLRSQLEDPLLRARLIEAKRTMPGSRL